MLGNLKAGLKSRIKGVVEDIKGRRVGEADPYVPASAKPTPIARPAAPDAAADAAKRAREAEAARAAEAAKAAEAARAAEAAKAAEAARAAEAAKAAEAARAAEAAKAAEAAAEAAKAAEAARAAEAAKAAEAAAEVEPPPAPKAAEPAPKAAEPAPKAEPVVVPSVAALAAAAAAGKVTQKVLHADTGSTDMDAYVARAKANGRDVSSLRGGTGLNRADDGTPYWGPVDNDSSRAKAAGKLLAIDQFECISCGTCVEQTDKVYYLPDDGKATPIAQDGPMDLIQDAIDACPVTCISWVTPDEADERGLATGAGADEG